MSHPVCKSWLARFLLAGGPRPAREHNLLATAAHANVLLKMQKMRRIMMFCVQTSYVFCSHLTWLSRAAQRDVSRVLALGNSVVRCTGI